MNANGQLVDKNSGAALANPTTTVAEMTASAKKAIMKYGALFSSISKYEGSDSASEDWLYCSSRNSTATAHNLSIVGWNDNVPKERFPNAPAYDGAWLFKNSNGTNDGTDGDCDYDNHRDHTGDNARTGDGGYFWVSYCDPQISNVAYAIDCYPAQVQQRNRRQSDRGGKSGLREYLRHVLGGSRSRIHPDRQRPADG